MRKERGDFRRSMKINKVKTLETEKIIRNQK